MYLIESPNFSCRYSHLFNKRGGWNKRRGGAKVAKSLNMLVEINMEGGIFEKITLICLIAVEVGINVEGVQK